jgi:hypothetical protein
MTRVGKVELCPAHPAMHMQEAASRDSGVTLVGVQPVEQQEPPAGVHVQQGAGEKAVDPRKHDIERQRRKGDGTQQARNPVWVDHGLGAGFTVGAAAFGYCAVHRCAMGVRRDHF